MTINKCFEYEVAGLTISLTIGCEQNKLIQKVS